MKCCNVKNFFNSEQVLVLTLRPIKRKFIYLTVRISSFGLLCLYLFFKTFKWLLGH